MRTGGQQLAQDQCREVALLLGQGVGVFLLQKGRDALVQRLLVVGGVERLGERLASFAKRTLRRDVLEYIK